MSCDPACVQRETLGRAEYSSWTESATFRYVVKKLCYSCTYAWTMSRAWSTNQQQQADPEEGGAAYPQQKPRMSSSGGIAQLTPAHEGSPSCVDATGASDLQWPSRG